jgi:arylsulfatase A-like enzyme
MLACSRRASVIVISIDTLRADRLPCYGYRAVETPAIDRFRSRAVLFEAAYTPVPQTLPAHATLFTGLLPARHEARENTGFRLSSQPETLAGLLRARGWDTGAAVSSAVVSRATGLARGFDFYDDALPRGADKKRDGSEAARSLARWIGERRGRPFFAFLHLMEPHAPREAPEPFRSRYPDAYDAEVAHADGIVGEFFAALPPAVAERSLVFLLSDHGEGLGNHGEQEHGIFLYRETVRVPLLMQLPRGDHAGAGVSGAVGLVDVFPTVAAVLGLAPPAGLEGISLLDRIDAVAAAPRRYYSETLTPRFRFGWSDLASLEDENYHYIEAPTPELYDLSRDPGETTNLAVTLPDVVRGFRRELAAIPRPFPMPAPENAERLAALAALGYMSGAAGAAGARDLPDPKERVAAGGLVESAAVRRAVDMGDDAEIVRRARIYLRLAPGNLNVWKLEANALERLGCPQAAAHALEEGLRRCAATALASELKGADEYLSRLRSDAAGEGCRFRE